MDTEVEQRVRTIVGAVCPSVLDWTVVDIGDVTVELPPRKESVEDMIALDHLDGYEHYQPGDDMYITIGAIHLRRPPVETI